MQSASAHKWAALAAVVLFLLLPAFALAQGWPEYPLSNPYCGQQQIVNIFDHMVPCPKCWDPYWGPNSYINYCLDDIGYAEGYTPGPEYNNEKPWLKAVTPTPTIDVYFPPTANPATSTSVPSVTPVEGFEPYATTTTGPGTPTSTPPPMLYVWSLIRNIPGARPPFPLRNPPVPAVQPTQTPAAWITIPYTGPGTQPDICTTQPERKIYNCLWETYWMGGYSFEPPYFGSQDDRHEVDFHPQYPAIYSPFRARVLQSGLASPRNPNPFRRCFRSSELASTFEAGDNNRSIWLQGLDFPYKVRFASSTMQTIGVWPEQIVNTGDFLAGMAEWPRFSMLTNTGKQNINNPISKEWFDPYGWDSSWYGAYSTPLPPEEDPHYINCSTTSERVMRPGGQGDFACPQDNTCPNDGNAIIIDEDDDDFYQLSLYGGAREWNRIECTDGSLYCPQCTGNEFWECDAITVTAETDISRLYTPTNTGYWYCSECKRNQVYALEVHFPNWHDARNFLNDSTGLGPYVALPDHQYYIIDQVEPYAPVKPEYSIIGPAIARVLARGEIVDDEGGGWLSLGTYKFYGKPGVTLSNVAGATVTNPDGVAFCDNTAVFYDAVKFIPYCTTASAVETATAVVEKTPVDPTATPTPPRTIGGG